MFGFSDHCESNPCEGDSTCELEGPDSSGNFYPMCLCPLGFTGVTCGIELPRKIEWSGLFYNSYIPVTPMRPTADWTINDTTPIGQSQSVWSRFAGVTEVLGNHQLHHYHVRDYSCSAERFAKKIMKKFPGK